ncbi:MAG: hypothetical protein AABZ61_02650 [Bacteroidota bacterium]
MKFCDCRISNSAAFGILSVLLSTGYAQTLTDTSAASASSIVAIKVSSTIHIDGLLDEKEWQEASVVSRFIQREPKEGEPVSERTEVRILDDEINLYIGFRCWDTDASKIVANEMRRDMAC